VIAYPPLDTDEVVHPERYATARIVTDDATAIAPAYIVPTVSLGVEPSVVYRIVAPGVEVDSVTLCAVAYVPGDGEKTGATTDPVIAYVPLDTDEVVHPGRYATARIVTDDATAIGPAYTVPTASPGIEPSVVYRMLAPGVEVDSVTLCAVAYVPGDGEKTGTPTVVPEVPPPPPHPTHRIAMITQASLLKKTSLSSWVHGSMG